MNKKGFTIVELIAVVVILSIIAMIATPNVISMLDNGKRSDYIQDAKAFISNAKYMDNLEKYKNNNFFEGDEYNKIYLKNIVNISDTNDPYGGEYDLTASYVEFKTDTINGMNERVAYIYLKSCENDNASNCHSIGTSASSVSEKELTNDKVTKIE